MMALITTTAAKLSYATNRITFLKNYTSDTLTLDKPRRWWQNPLKRCSNQNKDCSLNIVLKENGLFAFAGLWDEWKDPEGNPLWSFTIITTEPNGLMKTIHTRMPVILSRDAEQTWLNSDTSDALNVLRPYPPGSKLLLPWALDELRK